MKKLLYILIGLLAVSSCTKEVQIDLPEYSPKLVVEGRIEPGSPPVVFLTRSNDIYASTNVNDILSSFVHNADVKVFNGIDTFQLDELCSADLPDNLKPLVADFLGLEESQLDEVDICAYTSLDPNSFGTIGSTYELFIEESGRSYYSLTNINTLNPLDTLYFKENDDGVADRGYIYAKCTDPSGTGNAYRWQSKRINQSTNGASPNPTFQTPFNSTFDDAFVDGIQFDFQFNDPSSFGDEVADELKGFFSVGDTVIIRFSTVDHDVYTFFRQKDNQIQNGGSPFASPAPIPSNIIGGALGVWAGYGVWEDTVFCE